MRIIKNYDQLCTNQKRKIVLDILEEGISAGLPENFLRDNFKKNHIILSKKKVDLKKYQKVNVISYGKAADSMANAVSRMVKVSSGLVVIPKGSKTIKISDRFQVIRASHPIPDKSSVNAARKIIKFLKSCEKKDFVIFLVSGGGSSLVTLPYQIKLEDKIKANKVLLKSGATIQEINCIRKHISEVKGGRLLEHLKCDACALVMSDVEGDDLSSIASGCTYYDKTTFEDAYGIIRKYKIQGNLPKKVIKIIKMGKERQIPETPKKSKIPNIIIASNKKCLDRMELVAKRRGYKVVKKSIFGNIEECAKKIFESFPKDEKTCLIFGGESTVKVVGDGKGGRNQELILRLCLLENGTNFAKASIGTDGIDGNTKYAGAIFDKKADCKKIKYHLKRNDSSSFFQKYGGRISTGYTHTNLMDIGVVIR